MVPHGVRCMFPFLPENQALYGLLHSSTMISYTEHLVQMVISRFLCISTLCIIDLQLLRLPSFVYFRKINCIKPLPSFRLCNAIVSRTGNRAVESTGPREPAWKWNPKHLFIRDRNIFEDQKNFILL